MSSSRRSSSRPVPFAIAVLLLLSGCASPDPVAEGVGRSPSPTPSSVASTDAPPRTSRNSGGTSARDRPTAAAVPQYRATLAPVEKEQPRPARFRADSIDVDLPVISTGVADDGRMQLPESNRDVAWYAFGARPGDRQGTTVMAAHVDTRAEGLGPFARLRTMNRGDKIKIADTSGRTYAYEVTDVDDVKKSNVELDQLFRLDGDPQLKVLTCGGPYRRSTGYRDNIVVTARPVDL
ncbi:MAG: class F sortase [Propionibacteriaceae bacterium]